MSRSVKAQLLLVLITVLWGMTFVQIKAALNYISPLSFNLFRMTLAAVCLCAIFRKDLGRLTRQSARAGAVVGVYLWLGYEFQTVGLKYTTPSKSAFLTGMCVVLVPLLLALFFRRHVNRWTSIGAATAFSGLYLMAFPAGGGGAFLFSSVNIGDLLSLGCAVCFAFQIIFIGRATQKYAFRQIVAVQIIVCAMLMAISHPVFKVVAPAQTMPHTTWNPTVVVALLVTALFCTVLAFSVQGWAQQFTPPTMAALIFSMEPVFATAASWWFLGERLGIRGGVGAALILGGVLISELKGSTQSEMREETASDPDESGVLGSGMMEEHRKDPGNETCSTAKESV